MQKVLLELRFYRGRNMRTVVSARCKADPSSFAGEDVDEVLENLVDHLRKHAAGFGDLKKKE